MKRHRTFIALSRDHHRGLLLAARLQQGKKALLKLWSHDQKWQAEYVVRFFDDELKEHFRLEETFVFPVADSYLPEDRSMIKQLRAEHDEMRKTIDTLRGAGGKKPDLTLRRFGELLEKHIRSEEREFFPLLETTIPAELLNSLGAHINPANRKP